VEGVKAERRQSIPPAARCVCGCTSFSIMTWSWSLLASSASLSAEPHLIGSRIEGYMSIYGNT